MKISVIRGALRAIGTGRPAKARQIQQESSSARAQPAPQPLRRHPSRGGGTNPTAAQLTLWKGERCSSADRAYHLQNKQGQLLAHKDPVPVRQHITPALHFLTARSRTLLSS